MKILPTNRTRQKELIEAAHAKALPIIVEKYPQILERFKFLKVSLSEGMRTRGGEARIGRGGLYTNCLEIRMNARLHEENLGEVEKTYLHELAHVVSVLAFGTTEGTGHGFRWASVMEAFGLPAERCHRMDTSALEATPVRFIYRCQKCPKEYKLTRHKQKKHLRSLEAGSRGYTCRCGGDLSLTDSTGMIG